MSNQENLSEAPENNPRRNRLRMSNRAIFRLVNSFVRGKTACEAARRAGCNRNTANLWYDRLREASALATAYDEEERKRLLSFKPVVRENVRQGLVFECSVLQWWSHLKPKSKYSSPRTRLSHLRMLSEPRLSVFIQRKINQIRKNGIPENDSKEPRAIITVEYGSLSGKPEVVLHKVFEDDWANEVFLEFTENIRKHFRKLRGVDANRIPFYIKEVEFLNQEKPSTWKFKGTKNCLMSQNNIREILLFYLGCEHVNKK